jgi:DNA-binding transcriptional ArsR family regulator
LRSTSRPRRQRADPGGAQGAAVFSALADPTRRQLVQWLSEAGPATATELARRLPITRQAVAKHLGALGAAGLVVAARQGRDVRYRLRPEPLVGATEWMAALAAAWDERLEALARLVAPAGRSAGRRG